MARTRTAPPRLGAALVGVLLPLSLSVGCTEDGPEPKFTDSPSAEPTSDPTESEPSEPVEPVEPTPPAAMEGDDEAAAKAFVEYYFELVGHAQSTGETASLRSVQLNTCGACTGVVDAIATVYEAGGTIRGGDYTVAKLNVTQRGELPNEGMAFDARARVSNTAQVIRGSGDDTLDGKQAANTIELQLQLAYADDEWQMLEWSQTP